MPERRTITILGSGVALGVYIPALLLRHQLERLGLAAEVVLLEDLYTAAGLDSLERLRDAFHRRFELAKIAQRMTTGVRPQLDRQRVEALLARWQEDGRCELVVWSGFWMPLVEEYRARRAPDPVEVDVCRIDATVSPSFRGCPLRPGDREIWFWSWPDRRLEHELAVTPEPPVAYPDRERRLVIHGGGWGLGDYRRAAAELAAAGLALDRVVYRPDEAAALSADETAAGPAAEPAVDPENRTFMVDPGWRPWRRDPGEPPEMPPFGEMTGGLAGAAGFGNRPECHELYRLIRRSRAIVSKPGGGTLLDSLSSATPVVFLEPYGAAERSNAELWTRLGFGVWYDDWRDSGHDPGVLERLGANLRNRAATTIDYPRAIAGREHRRGARATREAHRAHQG
jgi:hypothetical protein